MNFPLKKENYCTFQTLSQVVPVAMKQIGWKPDVGQELDLYHQIMVSIMLIATKSFYANSFSVEISAKSIP